jgi:hypothetical protein
MAEVVGTAWVRIRALTTGLSAEVNDAFDDVSKKVQPAAKRLGDKTGDTIGKGVKNGIQNNIGDGDLIDVPGIGSKVDTSQNRSIFSKIGTSLAKAFHNGLRSSSEKKKSTDDFGKFFNKLSKFHLPTKAWIGIIGIPGIVGAVKAATYYLGGLVSYVGTLATDMVGATGAIAGAFAEAAVGAGLLLLAFKVKTPELEAFQKGLKGIGDAWKGVVQETQRALFPQLNDALKTLTNKLLPVFKDLAKSVGQITGETVKTVAAVATSGPAMSLWGEFSAATKVMGVNLGRVASAIAQILIPVFHVLIPLGQDFSDIVARTVEHWRDLIQAGNQSGGLQAFLFGAYLKAKQLMGALGDILMGIFHIFAIGNTTTGFSAFDTFDKFAERFRNWTESLKGQNAIKDFFEQAKPVMQEVHGLIGDIFRLFGQGIESGTGSENIVNFIRTLRTDVLPGLTAVVRDLTKSMSGVDFSKFAKTLGDFLGVLARVEFMIPTLQVLTIFLGALATALDTPVVGKLAGQIIATAAAIGILQAALRKIGLGALLPGIAEQLIGFGAGLIGIEAGATEASYAVWGLGLSINSAITGAFAGLAAAAGVTVGMLFAIAAAAAAVVTALYFLFTPFRKIIDELWEDIQKVISAFTDGRWMDGIKAIGKVLLDVFLLTPKTVIALMRAVITGVIALFTNLPGWIASAVGNIWGWLQDTVPMLLEKLGGLVDIIETFFTELPGKISGWVSTAADAVWGWLQIAIPLAGEKIGAFFTALGAELVTIGEKVAGWVSNAATSLVSWIIDTVPKIPYYLGVFVGTILRYLIMLPIIIIGALAAAIPALWGWITDAVGGVGERIGEWALAIWGALTDFIGQIPEHLVNAALAIWGWLSDAVPMAAERVGEWAQGVWDAITDFVTGIPGHIADAANAIWDWLPTPAQVLTTMDEFGVSIWDWFLDLPTHIANAIAGIPDLLSSLWDAFTSAVVGATDFFLNLGSDIVNGIVNGVIGFFTGSFAIAKNILSGFWDGIKDGLGPDITSVVETIWQNFTSFISAVPGFVGDALAAIPGIVIGYFAALGDLIREWWDAGWKMVFGGGGESGLIDVAHDFILGIPGTIIGWLGSLGDVIRGWWDAGWQLVFGGGGESGLIDVAHDAVMGIPGTIIGWIGDLGAVIRGWWDAGWQLVFGGGGESGLIDVAHDFIVGIPGTILGWLGDLGPVIWGWITGAWDWVINTAWPAYLTTMQTIWIDLPGQIIGWLGDLGALIWGWITGAWDWIINTAWPGYLSFLQTIWVDLPGQIVEWIGDLGGWLWDHVFNPGLTWVWDHVTGWVDDLLNFFRELPGNLADAAGDVFGFLGDSMRGALRAVIGVWNQLKIPEFTAPSVNILGKELGGWTFGGWDIPDINIPGLASGGIVDRATLALLGEGRFKEAVLPLPPGMLDGLIKLSKWNPATLVSGETNVVTVAAPKVYIQVKIGERDITDIVDTQVDTRNQDLARQLIARNS